MGTQPLKVGQPVKNSQTTFLTSPSLTITIKECRNSKRPSRPIHLFTPPVHYRERKEAKLMSPTYPVKQNPGRRHSHWSRSLHCLFQPLAPPPSPASGLSPAACWLSEPHLSPAPYQSGVPYLSPEEMKEILSKLVGWWMPWMPLGIYSRRSPSTLTWNTFWCPGLGVSSSLRSWACSGRSGCSTVGWRLLTLGAAADPFTPVAPVAD